MTDLEALHEQVARLQAQLDSLTPQHRAPPPPYNPYPPQERNTVPIHALKGDIESGRLGRDPRDVRRVLEAARLAEGLSDPLAVPHAALPQLRRLAAAKASGRSWSDALGEAGYQLPDDLEAKARETRRELDGVWSDLLPVLGLALASVNSVARSKLQGELKKLLA